MKRKLLSALLITALLMLTCSGAFAAASKAPGDIASSGEWSLLELINEYRADNGLQPLSMTSALQSAAGTRADELKSKESTLRPDGSNWATVLAGVKFTFSNATQCYMKNLPSASAAPAKIIATLQDTKNESAKPFRDAILSESFTHIGIGNAEGYWLWILTSGGCTFNSCAVSSQNGSIYMTGADIDALAMTAEIKCTHGAAYLPVSAGLCSVSGGKAVLNLKTAAGTAVALPDKAPEASAVVLDQTEVNIGIGKSVLLNASFSPAGAQAKEIVWTSSAQSVANVDKNGMVNAVGKGSAVITATAGKLSASCKINVSDAAERITLETDELRMGVGQVHQPEYTLSPAGCTEKVSWSTYPENSPAVKVSEDGKISAAATGKAYVIATTASGKTARIRVTVVAANKAVQTVRVSAAQAQVAPGGAIRLAAKLYPSTAEDRGIEWVSSDPSVAFVGSTGIVTGLQKGTVTISAVSSSGVRADCIVTVRDVEISKISFTKKSAGLYAGKQGKITPTVSPKYAPAALLKWTSSDPDVASVDQNGVVTAHKQGTATITVSAGDNVSASIVIMVKERAVTAIKIAKRSVSVNVGKMGTIKAQVGPSTASNKNVVWTSSNPAVVSVDANGRIHALSAGTAVITAASESNPNIKTSCTIKVYANIYKRASAYSAGKASAWLNAAYFKDDVLRVQVCYYNSKTYAVSANVFGDELLLYNSSTVIMKRLPIDKNEMISGSIAPKSAVYAVYTFSLNDYPELAGLNLRNLHPNSRIG